MPTIAPAGTREPVLQWSGEDRVDRGVRQRRFDVRRDGRVVPGLLWTSDPGGSPRPLVLLGHGGSGSKRQDYVVAMARRLVRWHGLAAAAIDGPVHGDRRRDPEAPSPLVLAEFAQLWAADGTAMTDAIVADWRATLTALQALPEVAAGDVGWWGLSMGTILGLPLVAAEDRIGAAVLGLMGLTGPTRERIERDAAAVRAPVLFLLQWDDEMFLRNGAVALFDALGSSDKRLHAQPGGHGALPAEELEASAVFLASRLGTAP